jgi:hypothetical protein
MTTPEENQADMSNGPAASEVSIRDLLNDWADAHRVKDADRVHLSDMDGKYSWATAVGREHDPRRRPAGAPK